MQFWIVCLVLFFGGAEIWQWVRGLSLPLPLLVVAGGLLAIASNAQKTGWLSSAGSASLPLSTLGKATLIRATQSTAVAASIQATQPLPTTSANSIAPASDAGAQLPNLAAPTAPPPPPPSFTIAAVSASPKLPLAEPANEPANEPASRSLAGDAPSNALAEE